MPTFASPVINPVAILKPQHQSGASLVLLVSCLNLHFHFVRLLINNSQGFGDLNLWPWNHSFNYLTLHINSLPGIAQWPQRNKVLYFSVCVFIWIHETSGYPEIRMSTVVIRVSMTESYWNKKALSDKLKRISHPFLPIFFLLRNPGTPVFTQISTLPFLCCILNEVLQGSDVCLCLHIYCCYCLMIKRNVFRRRVMDSLWWPHLSYLRNPVPIIPFFSVTHKLLINNASVKSPLVLFLLTTDLCYSDIISCIK